MVQQESADALNTPHALSASQPTDQAWVAAQNRQTHAWLRSPVHRPLRQRLAQRLRQLSAALPTSEPPTQARTGLAGQWHATVTNHAGCDLHCWQLWQAENGSGQPRERVTDIYPTSIAWRPDGSGFYYDRYLAYPGSHALYFHRVGAPQGADRCILYHAEHPGWRYLPAVSPDGRWLAVSILNGSAGNRLTLLPLPNDAAVTPIELIDHFTGRYEILHWQADRLIIRAIERSALTGRLVAIELEPPFPQQTLVPAGALPLMNAVSFGAGWVVSYLNGGRAELHLLDEQGRQQATLPLPGLGTVTWLATAANPPQVRYSYADYVRPPQVYTWQPGDAASKPEGASLARAYDPAAFATCHLWFPSADGTAVPLFLLYRRDQPLTARPTLLTAYGGLGHAHTPHFSAEALTWAAMGGVYAAVCARGGGELGAAWHQAAVGIHKQRTFDDVLAAARWLIDQGITTPGQLGLWGVSNGGLTAGACLTQAPTLFGAVVIEAALLDMLDYPNLGQGADWVAEYGTPNDPAMRPLLAAYSPLHNIHPGRRYPATLITTHEHDPRVGEAHSHRFAQALQAAQSGPAPILLRVDPGSGHATQDTSAERLAAATDRLTFLAIQLGLSTLDVWP